MTHSSRPSVRPEPRSRLARRIRMQDAPAWGSVHPPRLGEGREAHRRAATPEAAARSCRLTVGVRRADGTSASAVVVSLDERRVELIAPRLAVEVGDVVWLVLELGRGRPYTVVLTCIVCAVESEHVGLSLIGLPEDEPGEGPEPAEGASMPESEGSWELCHHEAIAA